MKNLLRIVNAYVSCIRARLKWIFSLVWATLIGILIACRGLPPLFPFLASLVISFCSAAIVYIYNDIMEYKLDRINEVDRPIAQGKVSRNEALGLVLILSFIAIVLAISLSLQSLFLLGIFFILGFLYSTPPPYLKRKFPLKNVIPPSGAAISSLMGGAAVETFPLTLFYASILFFTIIFALSSVGDLTDYRGDKVIGVETIAVRYGPESAMKLSATIFLFVSVITALTYSFFGFNLFTPVLIAASSLNLAWVCFSLRKNWRNPKYCFDTHRRIVLLLMVYQISFFVGVL